MVLANCNSIMKKSKSYGIAVFWLPMEDGMSVRHKADLPLVLLVEQYGRTWSIPKGHVEKEDACGLNTAIRETEEEVGLQRPADYSVIYDPAASIAALPHKRAISASFERESKGGPKEMKQITMYFALSTSSPERMANQSAITDPNITDSKWVSLKQAKKLLHKPDYKALVKLYEKGSWALIQNLMREGVDSIYY